MKISEKHIAPYLPYGLCFQCIDIESGEYEELPLTALILTDGRQDLTIGNLEVDIDDLFANEYEAFYPILRPISCLLDEDYREVFNSRFPHVPFDFNSFSDLASAISNKAFLLDLPFDLMLWLIERHFDIFGLIPQNLAVDINKV